MCNNSFQFIFGRENIYVAAKTWPYSFLGKIRVLKWHDLCHRLVFLKYYNGVTDFFLIFPRNTAEKSSIHCQFARQIACSQNAWITFCPSLWYTPLLRFHPLETRNRNVVLKNLNQKHAAAFPDSKFDLTQLVSPLPISHSKRDNFDHILSSTH